MTSAIDMLDSLGATVGPVVLLPLAVWTAAALIAETALRLAPAPASLRLPVRRALVFGLPAALLLAGIEAVSPLGLSLPVVEGGVFTVVLPDLTARVPVEVTPRVSVWTGAGFAVALAVVAAGIGLARLAVGVVRLREVPGVAVRDDATLALVREVSRDVGPARAPSVTHVAGSAPYTVGALRPHIVIPDGLDGDALRLVLLHEMAHIRRHDFAWTLAERAAVALCAAHPLVHILAARAALDRECIADGDVLAREPFARRSYADLLLHFASQPAPTLGIGAASAHPLRLRLVAMNRLLSASARRRARRRGRALAAATCLLGAGFVVETTDARPASAPDRVGSAPADTVEVLTVAEVQPEMIGGMQALADAIVYPRVQREAGIEGRVIVQFVVSADGGVQEAEAIRSAGDAALDEAALRAVQTMRFRPAMQDGQPVAVRFAVPVVFRLPPPPPTSAPIPNEPPPPPPPASEGELPELIGGLAGLQESIVYPELQKEAGVEGRVFVQFIVGPDGTTRDSVVVRSSGDDALDAAALAAVRDARFRPGIVDGAPASVQYVLPISFELPDDE